MTSPVPSRRKLLLVFALFIAGLAIMSLLRERSAGRDSQSALLQAADGAQRRPGRPLPEIRFVDEHGKPGTLADFRGRHVLLNVWATWCGPCRKEMPSLDALQRAVGDLAFDVVPLSIDEGGAPVVRKFYEELGLRTLGIYIDAKSEVLPLLGIIGIPTTLMIDPSGRELWRISGPVEWDSPEVVVRLRKEAGANAGERRPPAR